MGTWLSVDGVKVDVQVDSRSSRRSIVEVGQRRRAIDGTMRSSIFTRKKEWEFTTALLGTGDRDRLLDKLDNDGSMPLTCEGEVFGESGVVSPTHTRGSTANFQDSQSVLTSAASGTLRDRHWVENADGVLVPSTLLEGAGTNEVTRSEDLTHADWTATGLSARNADQASDPEGGATLDELVENSATSAHGVHQAPTLTADANYALSVWGIANTRNWLLLNIREDAVAANRARAWFNLSTGAVGMTGGGGTGAFVRAYVEDWTDVAAGLYRCVLVGSVGNSATTIRGEVLLANADGASGYAGDGSSSLYVGYAQLEDDVGSASTYIPTTTAAASRSADDLSYSIDFTPADISDGNGATFYSRWKELGTAFTGATERYLQIGGSGASDDPRFFVAGTATDGQVQAGFDDGSALANSVVAADTVSIQDDVEARVVIDQDASNDWQITLHVAVNGGSETSATADTIGSTLPAEWSERTLTVGAAPGGSLEGFAAFIDQLKATTGNRGMEFMRQLKTPDLYPKLPIDTVNCFAEIGDLTPVYTAHGTRWQLNFTLVEE